MASPLSNADPNPLISPWGLAFAGGLVLDPARSQGLDLSNLVVEDLPSASPVAEGVVRLQFPAAGGLLSERQERQGLTISRLAITSGAARMPLRIAHALLVCCAASAGCPAAKSAFASSSLA